MKRFLLLILKQPVFLWENRLFETFMKR